ncbi:hypothetical protein HanPI659440_Chr17g0680401 [Helianthus annuus]|nr:hypothetical protein HanPI659440_Chr17g0680401 [Helianthus annuus]
MAPKEKKRKPATKKENKPEELVMSEKRHNMTAYLDPEGKITELKEIKQWIRESRISKADTFSTPVYKSLVKAFWDSASVVQVDGTEVIQGQVNDVNVNVSPEILNTVLELQDDQNAPSSIPIMCTRGCLLRMKCIGDIFSNQINKGDLPMRYKFLLHVLIQCLSNRRAGYDMAVNDLVGLMVALVLKKPFSISKYILANMKENMTRTGSRTSGNKFWMYPRFLQMIMNIQHPGLPKADNDILKVESMIEKSLKIFRGLAIKRYKESEPPRKLFGALGKTDYLAPDDDKWRQNDSQSVNEELELKKKMEEKFGRKDSDSSDSDNDGDDEAGGDGGDAGASAVGVSGAGASSAGAAGATSAGNDEEDTESDDNPPELGYEVYFDV